MTSHASDGRPRDHRIQEESLRWKGASNCPVGRERWAGSAKEDRARFQHLTVVPLNERVMDTRGTDQTVADGRVFGV